MGGGGGGIGGGGIGVEEGGGIGGSNKIKYRLRRLCIIPTQVRKN